MKLWTHPEHGRLWKVTGPEGEAVHGGAFRYDLPTWHKTRGWVPGAWTPAVPVVPCRTGYHGCRDRDLIRWCNGACIWAMEARGVVVVHDNEKVVCESVRLLAPTPWDDVTARLFAVDVAAQVRHLNTDPRVEWALEISHRYALGDASAAAWGAASAAASAAAWGAASAAASAAAWAAAWDAASAASWAASGAASGDAASAAAWAAASAAARGAASAASGDAARARHVACLLWWIGAEDAYPDDEVTP